MGKIDISKYMEEDITNISKEETPIVKVLGRSKSNKTSLWGSFNHEYGPEDNLGKMTPSALEGLDEAERKKAENQE